MTKLFSFLAGDGAAHVGVECEPGNFDLTKLLGGRTIRGTSFPTGMNMAEFLWTGGFSRRTTDTIFSHESVRRDLDESRLTGAERILSPIERPPKVIGLGWSYRTEKRTQPIDRPHLFQKGGNNVIGPGEPVVYKRFLPKVVAEVELGIVIGKPGANIAEKCAHEHIAGYTVANDVTGIELECGNVWFDRKCISTFCPLGPCVIPFVEIGPYPDLRMAISVNGQLFHEARTSELLYQVPFLIHHISSMTALEIGDCIITGAPPGLPRVRPGDFMRAEIENIGVLENPVIEEPAT